MSGISDLFLANTKPFFQNKNIVSPFFLNQFNLSDYGHLDSEFEKIYDPDSRVSYYLNADSPELPEGFLRAGTGDITRDTCGEIIGVRSTKQNPKGTKEILYNSCGKLSCPSCVRKASNIKALAIANKVFDFQRFLFINEVNRSGLIPKHLTFNPNFIDKHGVFHENFIPDFSSMKNYHKSIKRFIEKYISPYISASVVFYHHHRFKDVLKTELKEMGHFHVIGFGYMPKYEIFQKKHSFIYTNEGSLKTFADIFRVARYELTHVIFPQKKIKRHSLMSESEFVYRKKDKDFVDWLLYIEYNEITREQVKESLHSFHSYFYAGFLSPYKKRYLKCKKTNKYPKGLKKLETKRAMRDIDSHNIIFMITGGITLRFLTKDGRYKYYTLDEAIARKLKVNENIEIKFYYDRLKFGHKCKQKYFLNQFKIKSFNLKSFNNLI
ncbi:hypothetical protein ES702_05525 [subsurface metagenome]